MLSMGRSRRVLAAVSALTLALGARLAWAQDPVPQPAAEPSSYRWPATRKAADPGRATRGSCPVGVHGVEDPAGRVAARAPRRKLREEASYPTTTQEPIHAREPLVVVQKLTTTGPFASLTPRWQQAQASSRSWPLLPAPSQPASWCTRRVGVDAAID